MTVAFDVDVRIEKPPEAVWALLTDWPRAPEWMAGIDSLEVRGPTEAGSSVVFRARGKERTSELTSVEPGAALTLVSEQGPVRAAYTYSCAPDGSGTRLRLVADCEISGPLKLLGPLLRFAVRRTDSGQPQNLKALLEGG